MESIRNRVLLLFLLSAISTSSAICEQSSAMILLHKAPQAQGGEQKQIFRLPLA
jgi:hypothetical protein